MNKPDWHDRFVAWYYQAHHNLTAWRWKVYRFFVAKPRQLQMLIEQWNESQQRNYNERRLIERQLREMIEDTEHFSDGLVLRNYVDYVQRFDATSWPAQAVIALIRRYRPNMANTITE